VPAQAKSSARARVAYGTLSENKLRGLLDNDREADAIVTSRGGKISRRHYARMLGCTPSALTRFVAVFAEFERALGIVTGPMRRFPEMRTWLDAAYDARELDVRDGKVNRVAFAEHFQLTVSTAITRHPPIRALLEEFDARVERDSYLLPISPRS